MKTRLPDIDGRLEEAEEKLALAARIFAQLDYELVQNHDHDARDERRGFSTAIGCAADLLAMARREIGEHVERDEEGIAAAAEE